MFGSTPRFHRSSVAMLPRAGDRARTRRTVRRRPVRRRHPGRRTASWPKPSTQDTSTLQGLVAGAHVTRRLGTPRPASASGRSHCDRHSHFLHRRPTSLPSWLLRFRGCQNQLHVPIGIGVNRVAVTRPRPAGVLLLLARHFRRSCIRYSRMAATRSAEAHSIGMRGKSLRKDRPRRLGSNAVSTWQME